MAGYVGGPSCLHSFDMRRVAIVRQYHSTHEMEVQFLLSLQNLFHQFVGAVAGIWRRSLSSNLVDSATLLSRSCTCCVVVSLSSVVSSLSCVSVVILLSFPSLLYFVSMLHGSSGCSRQQNYSFAKLPCLPPPLLNLFAPAAPSASTASRPPSTSNFIASSNERAL